MDHFQEQYHCQFQFFIHFNHFKFKYYFRNWFNNRLKLFKKLNEILFILMVQMISYEEIHQFLFYLIHHLNLLNELHHNHFIAVDHQ